MCKELMLVIEVDGITHLYDDVIEKDARKQAALEKAGFTVMRFTDDEVLKHINEVRQQIEYWIEDGGFSSCAGAAWWWGGCWPVGALHPRPPRRTPPPAGDKQPV